MQTNLEYRVHSCMRRARVLFHTSASNEGCVVYMGVSLPLFLWDHGTSCEACEPYRVQKRNSGRGDWVWLVLQCDEYTDEYGGKLQFVVSIRRYCDRVFGPFWSVLFWLK